ncbi:hypothetical protein V1525DRAFT_366048 [Lipomyces kononenkoae]|uniref:Uncharacterized protein n=1 Tax=Lipomyces kononenkoae TaxID=34357 RepID=A0ACC3STE8_LIPKO
MPMYFAGICRPSDRWSGFLLSGCPHSSVVREAVCGFDSPTSPRLERYLDNPTQVHSRLVKLSIMASPLYSFPQPTIKSMRDLRFGSARAKTLQAKIYEISKADMSIQEQQPAELYTTLADLTDALPANTPRFIVLSYPLVTKDGRQKTPYVLIYFLPVTATQQAKMLYAGAVEIVRAQADVNKLIEISDEDEIMEIEDLINE